MGTERLLAGVCVAVLAGLLLLGKTAIKSCDALLRTSPIPNPRIPIEIINDPGHTVRPTLESLANAQTLEPSRLGWIKVDDHEVSVSLWLQARGASADSLASLSTLSVFDSRFGNVSADLLPPSTRPRKVATAEQDKLVQKVAHEVGIDVESLFRLLSIEPSPVMREERRNEELHRVIDELARASEGETPVAHWARTQRSPGSIRKHLDSGVGQNLIPILILPDLASPTRFEAMMGQRLTQSSAEQFRNVVQAFRAEFPEGKIVTSTFELYQAIRNSAGGADVIVMGHSVQKGGSNERELLFLQGDVVVRLSESELLSRYNCSYVLTCYGQDVGVEATIRFDDFLPMIRAGINSAKTAETRQEVINSMRKARRDAIGHRIAISSLKITGGASSIGGGVLLVQWTGKKRDPSGTTESASPATAPE